MNLTRLTLHTPVTQAPLVINNNFDEVQRYLDVFYDSSSGIVTVPVQTSGRVKASKGEFVTAVIDNLVVRRQYTNQLENVNTIDLDYYDTYVGDAVVLRDPSTWENSLYYYVDVENTYYKVKNGAPVAFKTDTLGKQIEIMLDDSSTGGYDILLDPDPSTLLHIEVKNGDFATFTLIAVAYDASVGTTWAVRYASGTYEFKKLT